MKTEIKLSQAVGKTLGAVQYSLSCGQCVLSFTDDTFSTLGINRGHEASDDEISEDAIDLFNFGDRELELTGIVAPGEMDAMRVARDNRRAAELAERKEAHDRAEFERLKRKFEHSED